MMSHAGHVASPLPPARREARCVICGGTFVSPPGARTLCADCRETVAAHDLVREARG